MSINFTNTDKAISRGVKLLVHGESGAGKTYMVRTLLDGHSPVIISAEGGTLSLRDVSIPVIEVANVADVREAYKFIRDSSEAAQFDWVCIDSLSEVLEVLLADEKEKTADPRQAYGAVIDAGQQLVRSFRDLQGRNVYFSAKQDFVKDDHGRSFFSLSAPGSKLAQKIPYLLDEVFALRVWEEDGEVKRMLQTGPDGRYQAKDRSGALEFMESPNLAAIARKIIK